MIEMKWASAGEKNEIIDFCDFIFSKFSRPHDFETLLPKLYGTNGDSAPHHFIIREDGRIVAAILAYPVEMRIGENSFMTIGVGSVSVHPRAQGRGYMQHMLKAVDDHARELDAVFSVLGGQRQRYGYFGYHPSGYHMDFSISARNVKHALKEADDSCLEIIPMQNEHVAAALELHTSQLMYCTRTPENFLDVAGSWYHKSYAILNKGVFAGFAILKPDGSSVDVSELQLASDDILPDVLKKLVGTFGPAKLTVAPWQRERARCLTSISETWQITRDHMFKFYQEDRLRRILKEAGLPHEAPLGFNGFELPIPVFVSSPDAV